MHKFPMIKVCLQKHKPDGTEGVLVEIEGYLQTWMSMKEFEEVFPNVDKDRADWQEF